MKHSYHLDSLRGLLSLIVVMQHTATAFIYSVDGLESPINTYLGLSAHYSVLFFFVLSGYVITLSIDENTKRNGVFKVSDYVISRTIRIIPPLVGTFLLSLVLFVILTKMNATQINGDYKYFIRKFYDPDIIGQIKSIFTLTINGNLDGGSRNVNGALWSLVYEIQFYVFAGLIAIIITSRKAYAKIISSVFFALYFYETIINYQLNIQWISFICFLSGAISYLLREKITRSRIIIPVLVIILIFSIGTQTEWTNTIFKLRKNVTIDGSWMIYKAIMGLFFAVLLVHIHHYGKFISIFHSISTYSYSLYITHFPIVVFIWFIFVKYYPSILDHKYSLSIATLIVCLIFAYCFAYFVERPKQQRSFIYRTLKLKS
ncbi:acyltransferase [Escherichia coli]|uniref:acyltransferase family protein n=1 Tax=Escherichia coli TaxID=562 RepID=UPI000FDF7DB7|nr:acyltransferase [Escherichia coli]QAA02005.1 acyltransferase [Escherichia coli]